MKTSQLHRFLVFSSINHTHASAHSYELLDQQGAHFGLTFRLLAPLPDSSPSRLESLAHPPQTLHHEAHPHRKNIPAFRIKILHLKEHNHIRRRFARSIAFFGRKDAIRTLTVSDPTGTTPLI